MKTSDLMASVSVCGYVRVSTGRQALHEASIDDQKRAADEYCRVRNWNLVEIVVEPGASAMDDRRPMFQQMIDRALSPERPFDVILVHSASRFFRDAFLDEFYRRRLKRNGVRVISITQDFEDSPQGELIRKVIALFDEHSSAENAKHVLRTMLQNARDGFWNGSSAPYGYRTIEAERRGDKIKKKLALDEEEAEIVRKIFQLYLQGDDTTSPMGIKAISVHLNRLGVRLRGRKFHVSGVHLILTRQTYMGIHVFNRRNSKTGQAKPEDQWQLVQVPSIISEQDFNAVRATLHARHPKRTPPRVVNGPTLLTGLAKCAAGGGGFSVRTGKGGKYRYYACSRYLREGQCACGGNSVPMDLLDALVMDQLTTRLFTPERLKALLSALLDRSAAGDAARKAKLAQERKRLAKVETGYSKLYQGVLGGNLDPAEPVLKETLQQLKLERSRLEASIALLEGQCRGGSMSITPERIEQFAAAMHAKLRNGDKEFRKKYLNLFVDRIEVDDREVRIFGKRSALAHGISDLPEPPALVPSFVREWRALLESNQRPTA